MTGIHTYSTTASENVNANTGINWDEGMAPAAVNNSARQNMADIRTRWNDAAWFRYGIGSKDVPGVYASGTSFTLAGADATAYWHVGRRVKAVGSTTGTIYGTVTSSSFATSTTTVNVRWDSGSLSNESLTIYASTIPVTGNPISPIGDWTPTDASGAALSLSGVSASWSRVGNMVFAYASVTYPVTADGSNAVIGGLPFTVANAQYGRQGFVSFASNANAVRAVPNNNTTNVELYKSTGAHTLNSDISGATVIFMAIYPIA